MNSNVDDKNVCPCCGRHCSVDNLHCPRGRAYFGIETDAGHEEKHPHHHGHDKADMTIDDKVISLMRGCGHYLHHSMGEDSSSEQMLSCLSHEEKKELISLLKKCLQSWEN